MDHIHAVNIVSTVTLRPPDGANSNTDHLDTTTEARVRMQINKNKKCKNKNKQTKNVLATNMDKFVTGRPISCIKSAAQDNNTTAPEKDAGI